MKRSASAPVFLLFSLALGAVGLALLGASSGPIRAADLPSVLLLAAIALTMRLNRFTIPPRIVVSLVYTVQVTAVVLFGGPAAAWISVGTFLLSLLARLPRDVPPRVFLAVVSFNTGMEALMTLAAGAVYSAEVAGGDFPAASPAAFLSIAGLASVLAPAFTLKAVNEILMTTGSYLRGDTVRAYVAGARKVLAVEAGMLPLALLLVLVGATAGARGLAVAAVVLMSASILVKRLSDTRDRLHSTNVDLERRIGELNVLGGVSRAISSAITIDEVLEAIHRHCSELVDTNNFFLALLDRETGQVDIPLNTEAGKRLPRHRLQLGEGLTSLVIQRREPILIRDMLEEAPGLPIKPVWVTPTRTRSWLGVPLIAGDEVVGVMNVQDERPGAYDQETLRVLTTIAAQAAISIRNAQLVQRTVDQARLEQENRDLRLVNQRKNEFVNMVTHQLQAPLTAIIGFSDLVRRRSVPPESAEYLDMIHRESHRLSELVEQLLSLSRIRSGRISDVRRQVDLNAIAREVVDAQVLLIREREVRVDVALAPGGLVVDADPALLHQAVANLVNNALKYSPVRSAIAIRTEERPPESGGAAPHAVLSVEDSGPGVSPEDRERIFEEFFRSPRTETQQVRGSGLGLTIAREIVHIHGGRLGVETAPGGGSIFYFSIPAAARPSSQASA